MKLSIIIPVYNEREFILTLLKRVLALPIDKEVIVVDDHSTDGTYELLQSVKGISLFRNPVNMGKGGAVKNGISMAMGEYTIIQDADLEYSPEDIPLLLKKAEIENAIAVYGSRFKGKGKFLIHSLFANRVLTMLTNILFGGNITDMETCYKLMRTDVLKSLRFDARGFDMEPEITAQLLRMRIHIHEIPIHYRGRTEKEGKKIHWKDAVIAIFTLFKYWVL